MPTDWILLLHAATTLYMAGLIWFVQVVHYPLFAQVGERTFPEYEAHHVRRTGWVVATPMVVELVTAVATVQRVGGALAWCGIAMLAIIWASTWRWQVAAHRRLAIAFDAATHRRLVRTNWVRTFAWSVRSIVALALLVPPR